MSKCPAVYVRGIFAAGGDNKEPRFALMSEAARVVENATETATPTAAPRPDGDTAASRELREIDRRLTAPDAVLEKDIFAVATGYLRHRRGQIKEVIQKLSDNFVGYPAMGSLCCEWLAMLDEEPGAQGLGDSTDEPHDEFHFLARQAEATFSLEAYTHVFDAGGPPPWAGQLISTPRGRRLVYRLAAKHSNSLLLGWAIKRILADGHDAEVAETGLSMAGYFGVFHRLLGRYFGTALSGAPGQSWHDIAADLRQATCHGQHTYVFAQAFLAALAERRGSCSTALAHMQEDLALHAQENAGASAHVMLPLFATTAKPRDREAILIIAAIFQAATWRDVSLQHLQALQALYTGPDPPSVRLLQRARLFEMLSVVVMETLRRPSEAWQAAALDLVATAACLTDADLEAGRPDEDGAAKGSENGNAHGGAQRAYQAWADVQRTKAQLREAGELFRSFYKLGYKPAATFEGIDRILRSPLVAAAVVSVIHGQVTSEDFYTDQVALAALPHLIILLLRAVRLQPRVHARVLRLASAALPVVGAERPEAAKAYVRVLLELTLRGDALAALAAVNEWARNADPALVRFFIGQVLAHCDAPYSLAFARGMVALMARCRLSRRREGGRAGELRARLLQAFLAAVKGVDLQDELSESQRAYLHDLTMEFSYQ